MAPVTMYDSVDVSQIPAAAAAVAGYVNGKWPTYSELEKKFPDAHRLSIAVTDQADAECLDVEKGDATPEQAPAWVKRQIARGVKKPVVYCSVSDAQTVLGLLAKAGVTRGRIRLWTAHYTHKPHLCTKACGFGFKGIADATQYDDKALGRNLDASLCGVGFWLAPAKSKPVPLKPAAPPANPSNVTVTGPKGGLIVHATISRARRLLPGLLRRFGRITLRKKP